MSVEQDGTRVLCAALKRAYRVAAIHVDFTLKHYVRFGEGTIGVRQCVEGCYGASTLSAIPSPDLL